MAGGLGGIFDDDQQQRGPIMAAPGLPASALSGNPAATLTNLAAVGGAQRAGVLSNAVMQGMGALGLQTVNPQMLVQQRQEEFAAGVQQVMADGKVMRGDAIKLVADSMLNANKLPPNEYFKAVDEANKLRDTDTKALGEVTKWVNSQDAVKGFRKSSQTYENIKRLFAKDDDPAAQALAMFQSLKMIDPNVQVTNNEVRWAEGAARGEMFMNDILRAGDIDILRIAQFINSKGKKPTLSESQKRRWLASMDDIMEGNRNAARSVVNAGRDQWTAGGRPEDAYRAANASTYASLNEPYSGRAAKTEIGSGTYAGGIMGLGRNAEQNKKNAVEIVEALTPALGVVAETAVIGAETGLESGIDALRRWGVLGGEPTTKTGELPPVDFTNMDDPQAVVMGMSPEQYRRELAEEFPGSPPDFARTQDAANGYPVAKGLIIRTTKALDLARGLQRGKSKPRRGYRTGGSR